MNTFLFTWNPKKWPWNQISQKADQTLKGMPFSHSWTCGSKKPEPKNKCYLMMLGTKKPGIIACGWITSKPYLGRHWDPEKAKQHKECRRVNCKWETILDPDNYLPLYVLTLKKQVGKFQWTPQKSGIEISSNLVSKLERAWSNHLKKKISLVADNNTEICAFEGKERFAFIRHRQREQKLRNLKIEESLKKGNGRLGCEVPGCGFDFYEVYGKDGFEYAHVHHLKPLATRLSPSKTKLKDLAIVCANCHAIIHRGGECRPLEGLIKIRK